MAFVHLAAKTCFSLRDGVIRPRELAVAVAAQGMDAVGIADRAGLYGAVRVAQACEVVGVRPIFGADLALEPDAGRPGWQLSRAGRQRRGKPGPVAGAAWLEDDAARVTLIARSQGGYANLCRAISDHHLESHRADPHLTWAQNERWLGGDDAGLFVLLGDDSPVARLLDDGRPDAARAEARRWMDLAGPSSVLVGVTHHRAPGDDARARRRLALADRLGLRAVAHQAPRYLAPADARIAGVMDAVRQQVPLAGPSDAARTCASLTGPSDVARTCASLTGPSDVARTCASLTGPPRHSARRNAEGYLKTPVEMARVFAERPDALANAVWAAERCRVDLGLGRLRVPDAVAQGESADAELRARCEAGVHERFATPTRRHWDLLQRELAMVARLRLAAYFLTVSEIVDRIREKQIMVACRGSAAGSLTAYALRISDVDPVAHDLVFERFMNPHRDELPDIDLDVESARREDIYRDLLARYGADRVACVCMVDTFKARMAIREVGKALGLPPGELDVIAKSFPHVRAGEVRAALEHLPELRGLNLDRADLRLLFDLVERLDGLPRHIALHPSGVLLGDATLRDCVPLERSANGFAMAQFDKDDVEALGLCKLDILAVRMLSSMSHCIDEIARVRGIDVDLDQVGWDDEATYELVRSTRTLGCFQIESPGQRELIGKFQPEHLDDLVVDISLFRPGPVKGDMVGPFLQRRLGLAATTYPHPLLEPALRETYGVIVYHEQVMRCVAAVTGCDLSTADLIRRHLGDTDRLDELRAWILAGARRCGLSDDVAESLWTALSQFASFGFCKAHAAAFAVPTYRSAWLKAHFMPEFVAGLLTHDPGMYPRRLLLDDARQFGVCVLPLDVNRSAGAYRVERVPADEAWALLGVVGLPPSASANAVDSGQDRQPCMPRGWRWEAGRPVPPAGFDFGRDQAPAQSSEALATNTSPTLQPMRFGVRLGLQDVAGIDDRMIDSLLAGRPFVSIEDLRRRSVLSAPVAEALAHAGALDEIGGVGVAQTRRDLLLEVSERWPGPRRLSGAPGPRRRRATEPGAPEQLSLLDPEGPPGLSEYRPSERVRAELEVLGVDASTHVIRFYDDLLDLLGVTPAADLPRCWAGRRVRVAGAKVATQTPPVKSGQRIVFLSLDDATGVSDATFFESVHDRCAWTVFHSWLLVVEGTVHRTGRRGVSIIADSAWDLCRLMRAWREGRLQAALAERGPGHVDAGGNASDQAPPSTQTMTKPQDSQPTAAAGLDDTRKPPRKLWHSSGGSAGR